MWYHLDQPGDAHVPARERTLMAELLFFLAMLIQCGVFPMSPSSCQDRPSVLVERPADSVRAESP